MVASKRLSKVGVPVLSSLRAIGVLLAVACAVAGCSPGSPPAVSPPAGRPVAQSPLAAAHAPKQPVKLVFIHHSCGENWLADSNGGLGKALAENNYFVSDTNYGWGPDGIGDRTDITDWPEWFTGPRSRQYLSALYRESDQHCQYTRTAADPGGENVVVLLKSCFPNSNLEGGATDAAARGEGLTVANAKAIYGELLGYFATRPDRLFIAITAPPVQDGAHAANARAFNRWLVDQWLADYRGTNVAVFDFYNVLTAPGNHHRLAGGKIEHTVQPGRDTLCYPMDDDHPSPAGNRKATEEFVPLLNAWYARWVVSQQAPAGAAPAADAAVETGSAAESATVATPSKPAPPAAAAASGTVDDFEGDSGHWAAFLDEGKDTRLQFARDTDRSRGGAASLRIQYDLASASWAACSLVHDRPGDWSGSRGLSFYLHVEKAGEPITVIAYGGKSPEDLLNFECTVTSDQAAVAGWQRIEVAWSQLRLPGWQGDASQKYDPRSAMGVGLTFHSSGEGRRAGRVWIDDIALLR
ncbi:MAG: carbohydrate binding domain-containing protein [Thermoguttaceae bacterium]